MLIDSYWFYREGMSYFFDITFVPWLLLYSLLLAIFILRFYWLSYLLKHSLRFRQFVFDDDGSRNNVKSALELIHRWDLDTLKQHQLFKNHKENRI